MCMFIFCIITNICFFLFNAPQCFPASVARDAQDFREGFT